MKYKKLEEAREEGNKYRKKQSDAFKAEIRRMDLDRLKSEVIMRKEILAKITVLYQKDLALLAEAEEKLAIYLGKE